MGTEVGFLGRAGTLSLCASRKWLGQLGLMSLFSCLNFLRNKVLMIGPEPGGREDPKPIIERRHIEACGSLGECD